APKFPTGRPDCCEHLFCFLCINNWVKRRSECPLCKRLTRFIIKVSADGKETKVKVRQRTEAEFSHELANADSQYGPQEEVDITIAFAVCRICHRSDNADRLLLCDGTVGQELDGSPIRCNAAYHCYCLPVPLDEVPRGRWYCPFCIDMRVCFCFL
uniref:PHD-type domain-containing protein n=1 Tax=Syphacia muris TaxID=451379 RepID=A0A0N5A8P9_9BILA